MKFENHTIQEVAKTITVFILTFFNSSILIIIINANFKGSGIPLDVFDGLYSDFDAKWYAHIAPIFITFMFIQCLTAPVGIIVKWCLKKALIFYDNGFTWKDNKRTSKLYNVDYANLISGSELELSDPYTKLLCMIIICMMFGLGLPILFPLTLLYIVVIYVIYRVCIVYWFQKPPLMDDSLSNIFIYFVKYAVVFYVGFSYWMLTNRQMFENHAIPKVRVDEVQDYDHNIFFMPSTHIFILVVMFFVVIIYIIFYGMIFNCK
jgi:hypothetical protein